MAGAKAGLIYTDWPMMNGALFPPVEWGQGALTFLHDQGLVQLNHRIGAYVLLLVLFVIFPDLIIIPMNFFAG